MRVQTGSKKNIEIKDNNKKSAADVVGASSASDCRIFFSPTVEIDSLCGVKFLRDPRT